MVTAWNEISVETVTTSIESVPRRLVAVFEAKPGHTKY